MDLGLEGKNAIVTGGSLGIGSAIALTLAREGCNVAINYRRHDAEANEVVRQVEELGRRGLAIKADVAGNSTPASVSARVFRFSCRKVLSLDTSRPMISMKPAWLSNAR